MEKKDIEQLNMLLEDNEADDEQMAIIEALESFLNTMRRGKQDPSAESDFEEIDIQHEEELPEDEDVVFEKAADEQMAIVEALESFLKTGGKIKDSADESETGIEIGDDKIEAEPGKSAEHLIVKNDEAQKTTSLRVRGDPEYRKKEEGLLIRDNRAKIDESKNAIPAKPVAKKTVAEPTESSENKSPPRKNVPKKAVRQRKSVLVVDNDAIQRTIMEITLKSQGYEVIPAENGKQALEILESGKPNLVVMDVEMPVMNGFQAFREIRKKNGLKKTPVIFVTWHKSKRTQGLRMGAADYIVRPFVRSELLNRIKNLIH